MKTDAREISVQVLAFAFLPFPPPSLLSPLLLLCFLYSFLSSLFFFLWRATALTVIVGSLLSTGTWMSSFLSWFRMGRWACSCISVSLWKIYWDPRLLDEQMRSQYWLNEKQAENQLNATINNWFGNEPLINYKYREVIINRIS